MQTTTNAGIKTPDPFTRIDGRRWSRESAPLGANESDSLSAQDQKDIVEFLKGLSGEYPIVEAPKVP
jgi:hypothetical protein